MNIIMSLTADGFRPLPDSRLGAAARSPSLATRKGSPLDPEAPPFATHLRTRMNSRSRCLLEKRKKSFYAEKKSLSRRSRAYGLKRHNVCVPGSKDESSECNNRSRRSNGYGSRTRKSRFLNPERTVCLHRL